jgi:REP element-mobilizing transposase RayT
MTEYRTSGHAVWDMKYHLIWITKYRYKVLRGEVAERARDLIRHNKRLTGVATTQVTNLKFPCPFVPALTRMFFRTHP